MPDHDHEFPSYPLAEKQPQRLRTPSGLPFTAITLDATLDGRVPMDDLRVTAEALEWQAQIAAQAGRQQLAENFRRAAELVSVPEKQILRVYEGLRPARTDAAALRTLADELEREYHASRCAKLVREAAEAYAGKKP